MTCLYKETRVFVTAEDDSLGPYLGELKQNEAATIGTVGSEAPNLSKVKLRTAMFSNVL